MAVRACLAIAVWVVAANALKMQIREDAGIAVKGSTKKMPAIGFGTGMKSGPQLIESTKTYLQNGGRLIDTAQMYANHMDLAKAIQESGVNREDIWVTSKVNTNARMGGTVANKEDTLKAVDSSLQELGLDYLDLMLIHTPAGKTHEEQEQIWLGLIEAQRAGKVKSIGVSNFNKHMIENLEKITHVRPAVLQIEYHPWVPGDTHDLVQWAQAQGIVVTAYGSLGGSENKAQGEAVSRIADKHKVSNAQVLLKWALKRGLAVIPGATSEEHIKDCLASNKLELSETEDDLIDADQPPLFKRWHNCGSGCAK